MKFYLPLLTVSLLFFFLNVAAQPKYDVEHYSTEDGLPQKNILDIIQDKKGFMWFSTWDGISKFDGSVFRSYKTRRQGSRFDKMTLDKYGYIWLRSHDNDIFRFDPKLERFAALRSLPEFRNGRFRPYSVITTISGKTWLISKTMGCVCFSDTSFKPVSFNIQNHQLLDNKIESVYEDRQGTSWVLSNNGLYKFSPDLRSRQAFFTNGSGFACALEFENEIWFGSEDGLIYIYNKQNHQFTPFFVGVKNTVRTLVKIDDHRILISFFNDEFFIYDTDSRSFEKFKLPAQQSNFTPMIRVCYPDRKGNIWFETKETGVTRFDTRTKQIKHYQIGIQNSDEKLFSPSFFIWEDKSGHLWVHQTGGGFGYYDPLTDQLIPVTNALPANTTPFSDLLYAGFSDRQGNLWISTRSQGLEKLIFNDPSYRIVKINPKGNNNVRSMMEDHFHRLWVATKDEKITIYDSKLNKLGCITAQGTIGEGKPIGGMAYSMIEDHESNIWIGTKGKGIYKLVPNTTGKSYTIYHYGNDVNDPYSLSDDKVYCVFEDSYKQIWAGTYNGGLNLIDGHTPGRFYNFNNVFKTSPIGEAHQVRAIGEDRWGKLYIGATNGLYVFNIENGPNAPDDVKHYVQASNEKGLGSTDVFDICRTTDGDMYVATFGGGIDKVATKDGAGYPRSFFNYSTANGLVSDLTSQIKEDDQRRIWIVSESNIMRFDPKNAKFEHYHGISRLIKEENFSEGGDIKTSSGKIMLGTTGGFVCIDPAQIGQDTLKPYVAITDFKLANRSIGIGYPSPLHVNIDDLPALKLDHKQNFITLEFAALDYTDTKQVRYAYKLDGVDSDWIETREHNANYINLSPGKYTFHVRSTNGKGIWQDNDHKLLISIVPAFWQTVWAMFVYLIAGLAFIFFVTRWLIIFFRLKDRLHLEEQQIEMKTSFFTDISHEIRTPLTMIVSPVEHILETEPLSQPVTDQLQLVLKNSKRMLRLVNQILDFRKIQNQLLTVKKTEIGSFITGIATDFRKTADLQGIHLKISDKSLGKVIWIDQDSIEKMMYNLLSNAVKHTPKGKTIQVNIFRAEDKLAVQIKDNGRGMSNDIKGKLFRRFISYEPDKSKPSTGIGLSIVKEIVERHGAEIKVESTENVGTSFTVLFLNGLSHFTNAENVIVADTEHQTDTGIVTDVVDDIPTETPATSDDRETILLIEDDDDMRTYTAGLLNTNYKLLTADNGKTGLEIALKEIPDFVVSDIMMPHVNGLEFLDALRAHQLTSHIPLIFLTAKSDPDTELDAYARGADAFMTKPFSTRLLKARIRTIMEQRKHQYIGQDHKKGETIATEPPKTTIVYDDLNEKFLNTIRTEIEKNMSNGEFSIDDLISIMPMSRSVFVKKLKSLTDQSPIEFMRFIKIKHAAMLISTDQYSIKEVSHMIGINDTKYFSQRFREIMGMLPSEYKKSTAKQTALKK